MSNIANHIDVIVSSRINNNSNNDFLEMVHNTCGCDCNIHYVNNDGSLSLTVIYNEFLHKDGLGEVLVYIHDDIDFLKYGWGAELIKLFNEHEDYGIIGVAGSAQFDDHGMWWNYPKKYGQVVHRHNGKSWLTVFSPLLEYDLAEVCVIDGLFMGVCKSRISKGFDTSFEGFNHYDTSFCLANYVDGQTKIGVTTNIRLAHKSIGETKKNFFENLEKLNNIYKDYYPIDVDIDNKLDEEGKLG